MSDRTQHVDPAWSATGSLSPAYFESLCGLNGDPWDFASSPYQAARYTATLSVLRRTPYANALELG